MEHKQHTNKFFTWHDASVWMDNLMADNFDSEVIELSINLIGGLYVCRLVTKPNQGELDV